MNKLTARNANAFASTFAFAKFYFFSGMTNAKELASKRTTTVQTDSQNKFHSGQTRHDNERQKGYC